MIGLLLLQVAVVALFGVEPSRRGLEEIDRASPGAVLDEEAARLDVPARSP